MRASRPLLYVFRVILTGIHLIETGRVEANLVQLNERFRLPYIPELIEMKMAGPENVTVSASVLAHLEAEYDRLMAQLDELHSRSSLPEDSTAAPRLDGLLLRLRLGPTG